jgi:hypothetical protein
MSTIPLTHINQITYLDLALSMLYLHSMRTQCAWCLRFTKDGHPIGHIVEYAVKDNNASHGICSECFAVEMARGVREVVGEYYDDIGYRKGAR